MAVIATRSVFSPDRGLSATFFFAAVLLCAYFGGIRAGAIAIVTSVVLIATFISPPSQLVILSGRDDLIRLLGFIFFSLVVTIAIQRLKDSVEDEKLLRALV